MYVSVLASMPVCTYCDFPLSTACGDLEMVQKSKKTATDECKKGDEKDKHTPVKSEVTRKDAQEEGMKAGEDDAMKTDLGTAEPASGRVIDGQKQEETKSVGEK